MPHDGVRRTILLTALAMAAFAANSLLCRLALQTGAIDPWNFTGARIISGGMVLAPVAFRRSRRRGRLPALAAAALFTYALAFSLAYVSLDAGTGALLLFGSVQMTMIGVGVATGERPSAARWLGIAVAVAGVAWLVAPGARAPSPLGAGLMVAAGIAWAVYTLVGRGVPDPIASTARNFVLATPLAALCLLVPAIAGADGDASWTARGLVLAAISGALTSGLGYVIWYAALPGHSATTAASVQLSVPVLAAIGGVALLGEPASLRLAGAGALTLGGVALALFARVRPRADRRRPAHADQAPPPHEQARPRPRPDDRPGPR